MKTFLKICKKVKSGKNRGHVYGDFNKMYIEYHILSAIKSKKNKIDLYATIDNN